MSLPRSEWCFRLVEAIFSRGTTNQKYFPDPGEWHVISLQLFFRRLFWSRGETAFFDVRVTHVSSTNPQNWSSWSMRKRRKGSSNKELLTWKWDRLPPWIWHARTFPEQPSGQTFPKERRVLCQCHILAQNTQIFWNSKISPHMCTRVQNLFSQECWLFRWF